MDSNMGPSLMKPLPSIEPEFGLNATGDSMMREKKHGEFQKGSSKGINSVPPPVHQIKPPSEDSQLLDDEDLYIRVSEQD